MQYLNRITNQSQFYKKALRPSEPGYMTQICYDAAYTRYSEDL